jgi:hypothetical protein
VTCDGGGWGCEPDRTGGRAGQGACCRPTKQNKASPFFLKRHLGAPRQPPGCRGLALGLPRKRGWDWDAGREGGKGGRGGGGGGFANQIKRATNQAAGVCGSFITS